MSKPIGKSSSVNPSGTNDAKTHGTSSKMGNLLAGMLEADPDFKKVVSRYMNRAGFDTTTTSSTAHPERHFLSVSKKMWYLSHCI